jgi:glycosyltransferase involved in cell wall biosynthesis
MRIGFDISPLAPPRTGVGAYCYFLLKALLQIPGDQRFSCLSMGLNPVSVGSEFSKVSYSRHLRVPTRAAYAIWDRIAFPRVDRLLGGVDVYHATNFYLPPTATARRVVTIHDLGFLVHPEWSSPKIVGPYSRGIRRFVGEADAVLVYSESTKLDVLRLLGADPAKIHVAPLGVDPMFRAIPRDEARAAVNQKYGIESPFILFVSTIEPRKNVLGAIRAFERIAAEFDHRLVLVGATGWNSEEVFTAIRNSRYAARIVTTGYLNENTDLPLMYSAADAFLFPSHYEGFGLPVLEAFACACPVVTSNAASLPEVAGEAALMSAPSDIDGIAENLRKVLGDETVRTSLISKGLNRSQMFTWQQCAQTTLAAYRSVFDARTA